MRESKSDLWTDFRTPLHRIGISTNGTIRTDGRAVMGRGCARQCVARFPDTPLRLGVYLRLQGNTPGYLRLQPESGPPPSDRIMVLPVKHDWWEHADVELIDKSINWLMVEAEGFPEWTFHVPRLGCGNGRLSWEMIVGPRMAKLPDNVVVHNA